MLNRLFLVPALLALALAAPSQAGLFRKTDKPDPAVQVPALIQVLKTEKDEKIRAAAAGALREFDAKAFPDILPALTEALTADPNSSVRSEAAESIGKIRPISSQAGYALEQAIATDKSLPVRLSARTALLQYRILGYFAGKADLAVQTAEPPLAAGAGKPAPGSTVLRPTPSPIPVGAPVPPPAARPGMPAGQGMAPRPTPQTGEPPLADRDPAPVLTGQPKAPAPVITIPTTPARDPIIPVPTVPRDGPPPAPAAGPARRGVQAGRKAPGQAAGKADRRRTESGAAAEVSWW